MPLQRRIPKRGFTNLSRVEFQVVNVRDLSRTDAGEVTPEILLARGLIGTLKKPVKVLGMGAIEGVYQVSAHAFSGTAREKIEAAGGSATVLPSGEKWKREDASPAKATKATKATAEGEVEEEAGPEGEASESEETSSLGGEEASEPEGEQA
jgi:hypothetical protein